MTSQSSAALVLVMGIATAAARVNAFEPELPRLTRVRPAPTLGRAFVEGVARSPTFAMLLDRLERRHWLVFVLRGACPDPTAPGCLLHTVGRYGNEPYLRILVNRWCVGHPDREISTIAHELRHALEVAEAVEVVDTPTLTGLFRRIGYVNVKADRLTTYETDAARGAGEAVLEELQRARPRRGESCPVLPRKQLCEGERRP
jgi:hypothetical protein